MWGNIRLVVEASAVRKVFELEALCHADLIMDSFKRVYTPASDHRERMAWEHLLHDRSGTKGLVFSANGTARLVNKHHTDPLATFAAATKPEPTPPPTPEPTPGRVTESIYTGSVCIIPLAEVQHIEKQTRKPIHGEEGPQPNGILVITSKTKWDTETDAWANSIWIQEEDAGNFLAAWCRYRTELEAPTLANLEPRPEVQP